MQNVVLVIHLLLALSLIGVVLLQRSEGGGLGIGGSSGMGPQSGRPPLTGLAKLTWGFAIAFITTSIILTVIGASNSSETSVLESLGTVGTPGAGSAVPSLPLPDVQLPPAGNAPLLPPRQP